MRCLWRATLIFCLALISAGALAQHKKNPGLGKDCNSDYRNRVRQGAATMFATETPPEFPGGNEALRCYLYNNMKGWVQADSIHLGQAAITFEIDTCGHTGNIHPADTLFPAFTTSLAEAVRRMPLWIPATRNMRPIVVKYQLGLRYPLEQFNCE